ncbi:MAG: VWA domain-containing protein [Paracoccaceae bacterium]
MFKNFTHAALVAAALTSPATAQEMTYPDTIIILDVSNSMWGQIDGVAKISIARDAIGELVEELDTDSEFGLMAFGHRRKSDCGDIELILPIGPLDSATFSAAASNLTPRGRTPLTAALREAANILKTDTRSGRVILVSDGIESCEADPCSLSKELEKSGLDFTAHVIGFNISESSDQSQISCIAQNTEGLYLTAESTGELKEALETMMMEGEEAHVDSEMTPSAIISPQSARPNTRVSIDWSGPNAEGDFVTLALVGSGTMQFKSAASTADGWPAMLTTPDTAGEYEVRYVSGVDNTVLALDTITVTGE